MNNASGRLFGAITILTLLVLLPPLTAGATLLLAGLQGHPR